MAQCGLRSGGEALEEKDLDKLPKFDLSWKTAKIKTFPGLGFVLGFFCFY